MAVDEQDRELGSSMQQAEEAPQGSQYGSLQGSLQNVLEILQ